MLSVDFQLEILEGCKFHCRACHVDKDAELGFDAIQATRLNNLFQDFQNYNYLLDHLIVGPTDFTTSKTFHELSDEFWNLTSHFKVTNWTSTLLAKNWREEIAYLAEKNRSEAATFSIVMNPRFALQKSYLDQFVEKIAELKAIYNRPIGRFYVLYNVERQKETDRVNFMRDYVATHEITRDLFPVPSFDHGFSFTRSDSLGEASERIEDSMAWLNELYDSVAEKIDVPIQFLIAGDAPAKRYVYRRGSFYYPPLWHEPFINFDESFRIPVNDWKVREFEDYEQWRTLQQFQNMGGSECESCAHNATCISRGIVFLGQNLGRVDCLMPRRAIEARGFA